MQRVGFIGLGTMGRHMAKNIAKAGFPLSVYARRDDVAQEFVEAGTTRAVTPADLAKQCDVVVSIVTADPQVREIVGGDHGLAAGLSPGKLWLDMSTIGPATVREIGEKIAATGAHMIDAPVSGGPWGAEAGSLAIMCGGDAADYERALPILQTMGKHLFHCGPLGSGQVVKLVNQMIGGGIMTLIAEGLTLAAKAGADPAQMVDVLAVSSGNSSLLEARGKKFLLADQFTPGFMLELMRKDMALAVSLAQEWKVPTPVASGALQQYTAAMNQGFEKLDFAAVAKVYEQAAGTKIAGRAATKEGK
ncbi:MAG: hypothetical protein C0483_11635 [Pirellula sp.]|nr:hypothetical protein [Pirellula sp.]